MKKLEGQSKSIDRSLLKYSLLSCIMHTVKCCEMNQSAEIPNLTIKEKDGRKGSAEDEGFPLKKVPLSAL